MIVDRCHGRNLSRISQQKSFESAPRQQTPSTSNVPEKGPKGNKGKESIRAQSTIDSIAQTNKKYVHAQNVALSSSKQPMGTPFYPLISPFIA